MPDTRIDEGTWSQPVFFSILPYNSLKVLSNEMKINLKDNKTRQLLPRIQVINTYIEATHMIGLHAALGDNG